MIALTLAVCMLFTDIPLKLILYRNLNMKDFIINCQAGQSESFNLQLILQNGLKTALKF